MDNQELILKGTEAEKELKEIRATLGCKPGDELKMLVKLIEENKELEELIKKYKKI